MIREGYKARNSLQLQYAVVAEGGWCFSVASVQPKLKENPRDWLKFTASVCVVLGLISFTLAKRKTISHDLMWVLLAAVTGGLTSCGLRPRWFRGFYRVGMTVAFYVGQFFGRILLTLIFLLVLTPLGLLLRLMGKDLLRLKRDPAAQSYWQPVKQNKNLDREF